jgi:hypothetical protein
MSQQGDDYGHGHRDGPSPDMQYPQWYPEHPRARWPMLIIGGVSVASMDHGKF